MICPSLTSIYRDHCPASCQPCLTPTLPVMVQQDGNSTHFFFGLQIFLPRVTEKLDRIPKTPPADPEDQAKVPKVRSTITFQGNSYRRASAEAQQCLKGTQMGGVGWGGARGS